MDKKITSKIAFSGLLALGAQSALSGDMGIQKDLNFDGAYIGIGSGLMTNMLTNKYSLTNYGNGRQASPSLHNSGSGVMFSGNVGYGKSVYEKTYLGGKASILYTPINNFYGNGFSVTSSPYLVIGNNNVSTSYKPIYSLSAVLGYEVTQHILPFVEGGISFTGINTRYILARTISNLNTANNISYNNLFSLNKYTTGYNIGLGTNYHPCANWIFTGELMFFGFGKISKTKTFSIPANNLIGSTTSSSKSVQLNTLALFATASYLFA